MSKYLATALDDDELHLRRSIFDLEKANGNASQDIRLSSQIMQAMRQKMIELGLDPDDTTAKELYYTLIEKLKKDDSILIKEVRSLAAKKVNAAADPADGLKILLETLKLPAQCYTVKHSTLKSILNKKVPRQVMKHLEYRSLDSMIKREPLALLILAINLYESKRYIEQFYRKYKDLTTRDFENKPLTILIPKSRKWQKILNELDPSSAHQIVSCYELGTLIIMPVGLNLEPGQLTATLIQTLSEINRILSASTYLKVMQVRPDFSNKVFEVATNGPTLSTSLMGKSVPWHVLQSILPESVDLPYMNKNDLKLSSLIDKLCDKYDFLKFWKKTDYLGLVKDEDVVSLNILDVALNLYSKLDYEDRTTGNFRNNLWQELIKRYISPKVASEAVTEDLGIST